MKIEMGESLAYSWLKHVKGCQIVQMNWKPSPTWEYDSLREAELETLAQNIDTYFKNEFKVKYADMIYEQFKSTKEYNNGNIEFNVFKKNSNLGQIVLQSECDLIGVSFQDNKYELSAIEVAYHSNGLDYGSKKQTIMKITEKMARSVMCLYLYFNVKYGDIIFATPVIKKGVLIPLNACINELQRILSESGLKFKLKLIHNQSFYDYIYAPLTDIANDTNDTSELFLRSYQLSSILNNFERQTIQDFLESNENISTSPSVENAQVINSFYGKANNKIKKWAESPKQYNHKILRSYFKSLDLYGKATIESMESLCSDKNKPDMYVPTFTTNYAQMKIDSPRSHGKVFEDDGSNVRIWNVVKEELLKYKSDFCR